ncbi:MAG: helicase [candidate division WOR-3 bacterium]
MLKIREFHSLLGFVFEGAFKLGFLKDRIPDYKDFTEGVFAKLKGEAERAEDEELVRIIEDIESTFDKYDVFNPPENMKELSRLYVSYTEDGEGQGIRREWKEIYTKLVFAIGYAGGYFYGESLKDVELKLKRYEMGEESEEIIWQNADLVFVEGKRLHIIDFKLGGTRRASREILTGSRNRIPIQTYGIPVNLSLGELEFYNFLEKFMQVKEKLRESEDVFIENKGLLQVLSYVVDFLCSEEDPIDEVSLELLYPVQEPLNLRFFVKNRKGLVKFAKELKELYRDIKNKEKLYREVDVDPRKEGVRKRRVREEVSKRIEDLEEEIRRREKERLVLETGDINSAREDVKKRLENFVKRSENCKAIALLHSAGSGKTSRTRELILGMEGKHVVLYMATRLILLNRELSNIKKIKEEFFKSIELVYERGKYESNWVIDKGTHLERSGGKREGKLQATVKKIHALVQNKSPDMVWAFATIQSLVETVHGKKTSKTSEHLKKLLRSRFKDYHIHIILDEFLGYKNGFFAIMEILSFLEKVRSKGMKASLYIFDANGYSPNLLIKLLEEYKEFEVVPDSLVLSQYEEEKNTDYKDIPFEVYAKHGFPANGLVVSKKFIRIEKKEEISKHLARYIKETLNNKESTGFAFIQDKEIINRLVIELEALGLSSIRVHASSKKSQEQINKGWEDVILGTSSVSRGLDFSRPHKPVDYIYIVVQSWGIENNLVETIQALSRARGDEETESRPKYLHLIYIIDQNIDNAVDNIASYMDHPDKDLVRLIYIKEQLEGFLDLDVIITKIVKQFLSKPEDKVLVPVPTQHKSRYIDNVISKYENAVAFVEDIYDIEKQDEIYEFKRLLENMAYIYTSIKRNFQKFNYHHPYILFEDHEIFFRIENEKRWKLKKLFEKIKPVLMEHNEERTQELEEFLGEVLPTERSVAPLLIPVYSIVFVNNWLRENEKLEFRISSRTGRGHAEVLGGDLEPKTLCYRGSHIEYACIPLGENYPYKEVLSGRFAKFPVKFIKSLLEG